MSGGNAVHAPTLKTESHHGARANGVTGESAALLREYVGFIQGVPPPSTAGKLQPGGGKTTQAVRRRLNAVAETLGVSLKIRLSPTPLTSGHRRVGAAVGPASILTLTTIIPSLVASQDNRSWGEPWARDGQFKMPSRGSVSSSTPPLPKGRRL